MDLAISIHRDLKFYHVLAIQSDSKGFKAKLLDLKAIYELQLLVFKA